MKSGSLFGISFNARVRGVLGAISSLLAGHKLDEMFLAPDDPLEAAQLSRHVELAREISSRQRDRQIAQTVTRFESV